MQTLSTRLQLGADLLSLAEPLPTPNPPLHSCTSQHSPFPTLQFAHLPGKGRAVQGAGCCVLLASCGLAGSHTTAVAQGIVNVVTFPMVPAAWEYCASRKARASSSWFLW